MMRNVLMKKYEKGLSLIEASMVLALSAIVISGVMFYYQSASDSNKTQNTISEVMSTIAAINGLYVGQSSYAGLGNSILHSSSAIPQSYKGSGENSTTITNPFGGEMLVYPGGTNTNMYAITLTQIPQSSCLNIASMNLGTSLVGVGTNFEKANAVADAKVANLPTPASGAQPGTLYSSMTPAAAASICKDATDSISFVMR
ncbi:pilus assembly protein [Salmonella enterica]|nr:pilus assembly protein [Salmonella enterica]ECC9413392.1 pilus assembly protein [Salmonella enterica subsp. enterica]EHF1447218.1 pilus assembly protein [Salmonella enterica subsp. enterica serovar 4,5,12:b:-]EHG1527842.1 pilus assembly protein [Salmonella enterica subsp. enterica serovar 4,[5],12:b:-]ECD8847293.1 pilus assembly protein [Salmonella enterica subsp. enterica]